MEDDIKPVKLQVIQGGGPTLRRKIQTKFRKKFPNANLRAIAGISAVAVAFISFVVVKVLDRPVALEDQLPPQAAALGKDVKLVSAALNFDGSNGSDLIKRRVGYLSTPDGVCRMMFEVAYQPDNGLAANIIDVSECAGVDAAMLPNIPRADIKETFLYGSALLSNTVCSTPVELDTLKAQAGEHIKGFSEIASLDVVPFRDCAENTSVIRPAYAKLKDGTECEFWAKFDPKAISLYRTFDCPTI